MYYLSPLLMRHNIRSPYRVLFLHFFVLNVFFQVSRHIGGQGTGLVVELWHPSVDLVQLQEYAWGALVVVVVVLERAWSVLLDVDITHHTLRWWLIVITVVNVLTTA